MNNPIFIEYYSHEKTNCFKINIPWTKYNKHTIVLCPEIAGIEKAREIAKEVLNEFLEKALLEKII